MPVDASGNVRRGRNSQSTKAGFFRAHSKMKSRHTVGGGMYGFRQEKRCDCRNPVNEIICQAIQLKNNLTAFVRYL